MISLTTSVATSGGSVMFVAFDEFATTKVTGVAVVVVVVVVAAVVVGVVVVVGVAVVGVVVVES
jgi:hypothetical protein